MTRRITTIICVLEILVAVFFFGSVAARAAITGTTTNTNGTQSTIDYTACAGDILDLFNSNLDDRIQQWAQNTAQQMVQDMLQQGEAQLLSYVKNFLGKYTIIGGALTAVTGGRFMGFNEESVNVTSSREAAQDRQTLVDSLRSNFIANCTATVTTNAISNTVANMLQTQGPDGGAAWAQDWVDSAFVQPDQMAYRRFWTELVNTNICSYMKKDVLDYFGVPQAYRNNPPSMNLRQFAVNADAPFAMQGACALANNYNPSTTLTATSFAAQGGYAFLSLLSESQNNLQGFLNLAGAELARQRDAMTQSAAQQLVAGGGFLGIYGDVSQGCQQAPDGNGCINYGRIKQAPGAVRDIADSNLDSYYNRLANVSGNQGMLTNISAEMATRLADLANAPLPLALTLGPEQSPYQFTPAPTPAPTLAPGASPTPASNDPVCIGGDSRCTCIQGSQTYAQISQSIVAPAIAGTMQAHPEFFVNGTSQIAPGVNYRTVLQAVCAVAAGGSACHPHPTQDDMIVFDVGTSVAIRIITPDGFLSTTGGEPIVSCPAGVL